MLSWTQHLRRSHGAVSSSENILLENDKDAGIKIATGEWLNFH